MAANLAAELQALADVVVARRTVGRPRTVPGPPRPLSAPVPTEAAYHAALGAMDWHYDRSDCHATYCAGRDALASLTAMAQRLDPSRTLWATYAP